MLTFSSPFFFNLMFYFTVGTSFVKGWTPWVNFECWILWICGIDVCFMEPYSSNSGYEWRLHIYAVTCTRTRTCTHTSCDRQKKRRYHFPCSNVTTPWSNRFCKWKIHWIQIRETPSMQEVAGRSFVWISGFHTHHKPKNGSLSRRFINAVVKWYSSIGQSYFVCEKRKKRKYKAS